MLRFVSGVGEAKREREGRVKKEERSKSSGEPFVPWADRGASAPTSAERPSCTHDAKLFPDARAQESARRCERTDRSTNAADRGARAELSLIHI